MSRHDTKATALNPADLSDEFRESNSATYCPEDNKLRLYLSARVERDSFEYLRKIGYVATPKQECSFAATWSIDAENAAFDLIADEDDIGDEDTSPAERAADRAERFAGYRDKRRTEAHELADRFDAGPAVVGYQNQDRADRAARRLNRTRDRSCCQWSKAEYWQTRTAGVISHALHRSSAHVRRGRILKIEKELRGAETGLEDARKRWRLWKKVSEITDQAEASEIALRIAGASCSWDEYKHPRKDKKSSLWSLLDDREDPITGHEAAAMYLARRHADGPGEPGSNIIRAIDHLKHRLAYENAMLAEEGGKATDTEIEVGGWLGSHQIHKIHRSPVTKQIVSVQVIAEHNTYRKGKRVTETGPVNINIQRLGEEVYRAPTDEERDAFKEAKAAAPKDPALVNPTDADAERLNAHLHRKQLEDVANDRWKQTSTPPKPAEIVRMTQAEFSRRLKWGGVLTRELYGARMRLGHSYGGSNYSRFTIIILTDKPQKPLPIDWQALEPEPIAAQVAEVAPPAPVATPRLPRELAAPGRLF